MKASSAASASSPAPRPCSRSSSAGLPANSRRPRGEHGDAVAVAHGLVDRLGGEHQGQAPAPQLVEPGPQAVPLVRAERGRRLVQQQRARATGEGDRQVQALERAGAELARRLVGEPPQVGAGHQLLGGGVRVARALQRREQPQVLARREARVERRPLRHPAHARGGAVGPGDGARARAGDPGEDREQRGLAGAVGPQQGDRLPGAEVEVDAVEGREVAIEAAQPASPPASGRRARSRGRSGREPAHRGDCRSPPGDSPARPARLQSGAPSRASASLGAACHRDPGTRPKRGARPGAGAVCVATAARSSRRRSRWRPSPSSR